MSAPPVPWPFSYRTVCDRCGRRETCQEVLTATGVTGLTWRVVALCADCGTRETP